MSNPLASAAEARSLSNTERFLRRRQFLIHKKLQSQLLLKSLLHTALIMIIMGAALFGPLFITLLRDCINIPIQYPINTVATAGIVLNSPSGSKGMPNPL